MALERLKRALKHVRDVTFIVVIPGILSLGDMTDTVPVRPVLEHYFGVDNVALVAMFLAVFFGLLKLWVRDRPRGDKPDADDGEPF